MAENPYKAREPNQAGFNLAPAPRGGAIEWSLEAPPKAETALPLKTPETSKAAEKFLPAQKSMPDRLPNGELPSLDWAPSGDFKTPAIVRKPIADAKSVKSDEKALWRQAALGAIEPNFGPDKPVQPEGSMVKPPPAPPKAKAKREVLSEHHGYKVCRIVFVDGEKAGQVHCFELMRDKDVIIRGSEVEIRRELKQRLQGI